MLEDAPVPSAAFPYDGSWEGGLVTHEGSCRSRYSFRDLTVRDGQVSGFFRGIQGRYILKGVVRTGGMTEMKATGGTVVEMTGKFDEGSAEGSWLTHSGCVGIFRFDRLQ